MRNWVQHCARNGEEIGISDLISAASTAALTRPRLGVELTLGGDLTCVSGVGASASSCVAITRAVAEAQGRALSDAEVNAAAYEGEKGYHGTPSGIDNTAACYGGVIQFERTADGPVFKQVGTYIYIWYSDTRSIDPKSFTELIIDDFLFKIVRRYSIINSVNW